MFLPQNSIIKVARLLPFRETANQIVAFILCKCVDDVKQYLVVRKTKPTI